MSMTSRACARIVATVVLAPYQSDFATETANTATTPRCRHYHRVLSAPPTLTPQDARALTGMGVLAGGGWKAREGRGTRKMFSSSPGVPPAPSYPVSLSRNIFAVPITDMIGLPKE